MKPIYLYIAGGLVALIVIYLIMKRTGLIRSKEQKKTAEKKAELKTEKIIVKQELNNSDAFNPTFYKSVSSPRLLTAESAVNCAKVLRKAVKGAGTDEGAIFGIFRKLKAKTQVSQIAYSYQSLFNSDLLTDLVGDLSKKDLVSLNQIVNALE